MLARAQPRRGQVIPRTGRRGALGVLRNGLERSARPQHAEASGLTGDGAVSAGAGRDAAGWPLVHGQQRRGGTASADGRTRAPQAAARTEREGRQSLDRVRGSGVA
jgi:hypothetical protein